MEAEKAREEGNDVTAEPFLKPVKGDQGRARRGCVTHRRAALHASLTEVHAAAAAGFARSAEAYDRARPEYPEAGVERFGEALGLRPGSRVLDVGAGTGKLTAPLAERGAEVLAVEPVAEMRARIAAADGPRDRGRRRRRAPARRGRVGGRDRRRPGLPLVRHRAGAGRVRPVPAAGRPPRADLEPPQRRRRAAAPDHRLARTGARRRTAPRHGRLARGVRAPGAVHAGRRVRARVHPGARPRRTPRPRGLDQLRGRPRAGAARRAARARRRALPRGRDRRASLRLRGVRVRTGRPAA